jgi:kexin
LPKPRLSDDQHGTRCAGEIAAAKNDVCGVGVAYNAKVAGIRILSASISDADEASALNFGYQDNDIYSCSWGPPDDGRSMEAPSPLIYKSMLNGVQNGRGGKGSIFVFASGNGGAVDDQCNFDGYTNSIFSITISAIDRKGLHPYYSEGCSANMVVTYSSGSGDNIVSHPYNEIKSTAERSSPEAYNGCRQEQMHRPSWRNLRRCTHSSRHIRTRSGSSTRADMAGYAAHVCTDSHPR